MKQMATVMLAITVLIIILFCILVKPGVKYREIGNIIQKYAQAHSYAVVKSFCGHGIHEEVYVDCVDALLW